MKLQTIIAAASPEVPMNENAEALDAAATFGIVRRLTTGLTLTLYGGARGGGGAGGIGTISQVSVALTANTTNYVESTLSGTVTKNTTGFTAGQIPLYTVVTGTSSITTITDQRVMIPGLQTIDIVRLTPNAPINPGGAGVAFPPTQLPSTDVNVLDDYEEGNWVPSIGGTATYTIQAGRYVKIGKKVSVWGRIAVNALGTGSTTTISGLPFTSANVANLPFPGQVSSFASLAHSVVFLGCQVTINAATITFNELTAAAAATTGNAAIIGAGTDLSFSAQYETAT